MSQSNEQNQQYHIQNYRLKPNQFKKETIDLNNIPAQTNPYRIPGTKIGIVSSEKLNPNKFNVDHLNQLLIQTQLAIDVVKRATETQNKNDLEYEGLEITHENISQLSHKQSLQLLNDLAELRGEIRKILQQKDEWVEVITKSVLQKSQQQQTNKKQSNMIGSSDGFQQLEKHDQSVQNQINKNQMSQANNQADLQSTDLQKNEKLSTNEVQSHLSQLKQQQIPPEPQAPYPDVQNRPFSLNLKQSLLNKHQNETKNSTHIKQVVQVQYPDTQKYRHIRDFKQTYESEYEQQKLKPKESEVVYKRDFIKENIITQQFYRRGIMRKVNEFGEIQLVFDNDYSYDRLNDPKMDELIARIQNQQKLFGGFKKDESTQKTTQPQPKLQKPEKVEPQTFQPTKQQEPTQQKEQTLEKSDFKQQIEEVLQETQRSKLESIIKDTILQNLSKKLSQKDNHQKPKKTVIKLPQFFQEYVDGVEEYKTTLQKNNYDELQLAIANNAQIIIDRNAKDFKESFTQICDQITTKIIDEQISKAIAELVQ